MTFKRVLSALLSATLLTTGIVCTTATASANQVNTEPSDASVQTEVSKNEYGLVDSIQNGVIFHAFCWKYNDITDMLPQIAEAGFSSVQTSPPQPTAGTGSWWWFYQPSGFYMGTSAMGTKSDYERLCAEAEKYGIMVIADVVANHLAGDHNNIQDDLKDSQYWHDDIGAAHDGDRYSTTHGTIGMPDLNTEHSYVQQAVKKYIEELKSAGVDGIRFDAAKHIGLPSEGDNFWPTVTSVPGLWYYGEILNNSGAPENTQQDYDVLKEYSQYMTLTDSKYGKNLRDSFNGGTAPEAYGNWVATCLPNNKLLYWGESHDTWSNNKEWGFSNEMTQNTIDRAYAVAASRNEITALYFSRPSTAVKDDIHIGVKGSTHFTAKEVAAVNHFHNAMVGQKDYYTTGDNCSVVCREKGAVVVLGSGGNRDVSVPNGGGTTAPGTYTDEITGNTWTVTSSTISGKVGETGIAVIYNPGDTPVSGASVSATPNTSSFTEDTLTVKLSLKGAASGTYETSEGDKGTFTDGQSITIGSKTKLGGTVTLTLKATGEDGKEVTKTFTYTKVDPNAKTYIYFDNSAYNWSNVYAYVYEGSGESAKEMAAWPGVKMTDIETSTGYYMLDVESMKNGQVIFSDGTGSDDNRYPADMQPGMKIEGTSKLFSKGNSWTNYNGSLDTDSDTDSDTESDTDTDQEIEVLLGDATQDGKVSLRDATMALKHIAGIATVSGAAFLAADVDENGSISTVDAVAIQRYNVGYDYKNTNGHSIGAKVKLKVN